MKTSEEMLEDRLRKVNDQRDDIALALKAMIRQAEQSSDFDQREISKARAALREAQA